MTALELVMRIAHKADYISDIAQSIATAKEGRELGVSDTVMLNGILRDLENIADAIDEYHDWGEED